MFKIIKEQEQEIWELKNQIKDMSYLFAGILETCNNYKKKNLAVSYVGLEKIKQLANAGLEIKNESELNNPDSNE